MSLATQRPHTRPPVDSVAVPDSVVPDSVAVLGCGLIGGSLLLALRQHAPDLQLLACDSDPDTRRRLRDTLAIYASTTPDDSWRRVDLVVLAVPVDTLLRILPDVAALLDGSPAVLTDVGGIKLPIESVMASLGRDVTFVGGHPMAGRERGGFENADAALFADRPVAITPPEGAPTSAVERVEALWRQVGAHPVRCTAEEHDRAVAYVSHVPHLVAASMAQVATQGGPLARALAAGGFRDTTRLAEDPTIRHAVARNTAVPEVARAVAGSLRELADRIETGEDVDRLLDDAAAARRSITRPTD